MMETQDLIHNGPPWHRHDDFWALCIIIFCLSVVGIHLLLDHLNERNR